MESLKNYVKVHLPGRALPVITSLYIKLRQFFSFFFYFGFRHFCPCCCGHFRKFLLYRAGKRTDIVCPVCFSWERQRFVMLFLRERTSFFSGHLRVLHFAPEKSFRKAFRKIKGLDYVSADIDQNVAMLEMDVTNIRFVDNTFDVIICNHVLEHVADDKKAMGELFRVLKPQGWAILQVPIDAALEHTAENPEIVSPEEREKLFGQFDHVRLYGRDYRKRLEEAGFKVTVHDYARELGPVLREIHGIPDTASEPDIYYCEKPRL